MTSRKRKARVWIAYPVTREIGSKPDITLKYPSPAAPNAVAGLILAAEVRTLYRSVQYSLLQVGMGGPSCLQPSFPAKKSLSA
jgi:hypothetical protein